MNIYHVSWSFFGCGLNAVVVANNANEAQNELRLDKDNVTDIEIDMLGLYAGTATDPFIICEESL